MAPGGSGTSALSEKRFAVRCSRVAGEYLQGIRARARDENGTLREGNRWTTVYSALRACLDELIPRLALERRFALAERGGVRLAGIFRHHVGRLVVFWIASSAKELAIVLLVGYRKEGDQNDAYRVLERHLRAGQFDRYFEELGQRNPLGQ